MFSRTSMICVIRFLLFSTKMINCYRKSLRLHSHFIFSDCFNYFTILVFSCSFLHSFWRGRNVIKTNICKEETDTNSDTDLLTCVKNLRIILRKLFLLFDWKYDALEETLISNLRAVFITRYRLTMCWVFCQNKVE